MTRGCIGYVYAALTVTHPPGWLNATWNNVTEVNWTGIDLIGDGHGFLGDNVVLARDGGQPTLAGVILEMQTLPATVNKSVVRGFEYGVWVMTVRHAGGSVTGVRRPLSHSSA